MEKRLTQYFAHERARPKQIELASRVYEALADRKHLILQAPTGFGKTAGVLAGILPFIEETESRVYYTVKTHREAEGVIRELSRIETVVSFPFKVSEIRGKRHLCRVALERGAQAEIVDRYCRKLVERRKCPFYLALKRTLPDFGRSVNYNILSSKLALQLAAMNGTCPYYLMKSGLASSDLIIMPYPYITLDHLRRDLVWPSRRQSHLVIDECIAAHVDVVIPPGDIKAKDLYEGLSSSILSIRLDERNATNVVENRIYGRRREFSDKVLKVSTETGRTLELTENTGVLRSKGSKFQWCPASYLRVGSVTLVFEEGRLYREAISDIVRAERQIVYDFACVPDHNYIANGFVVHNSHNMPFVIGSDRSWKLRVADLQRGLLEIYSLDIAARAILIELLSFLKGKRIEKIVVMTPSEFIGMLERRFNDIPFDRILQILTNAADSAQEKAFSSDFIAKCSLAYVAEFFQQLYGNRLYPSFFLEYVTTEEFPACYLELSSFDSSSVGRSIFRHFRSVIHVSGTNEWEEAYVALTGVPTQYQKCVIDPYYNYESVFLAVLETMSSRESDRTEEKYRVYSENLAALVNGIGGKSALYFPSFKVLCAFREEGFERAVEKQVHWEEEGMNSEEHREMVSRFVLDREKESVLVGVMGGRSAEGMDFGPGMLRGVVVFGIPFPEPSPKMEKYVQYLNRKFCGKGELYGYSYPAVIKAAQAVGRAYRSPDDRVALILADDRYFSYEIFGKFPNWIRRSLKGRYADNMLLLDDLERFLTAD